MIKRIVHEEGEGIGGVEEGWREGLIDDRARGDYLLELALFEVAGELLHMEGFNMRV